MNATDVSIIIVNYNTHKLLRNCLISIIENTKRCSYEIIVVDNASTDNSREIVTEFTSVKWIQSEVNLGFGKANNIGSLEASGKYLFFLNSDTILLNDAISIFYDFFEENNKNEELGAGGSYLLDLNHNDNLSYASFPSVSFEWKYLINKILKKSDIQSKTNKEVDVVTGADLFIKKDTFQMSGGFDPQFFMYYEETDLQFRLRKLHKKNVIIVGPLIIHLDGGSFKHNGLTYNRFCMAQKSYNYYVKKNVSVFNQLWYRFNLIILRISVFFSDWTLRQKIDAYKIVIFNKK